MSSSPKNEDREITFEGESVEQTPAPGIITMRPVGFFPGLGSRSAYRELERDLFACGLPVVRQVFSEAGAALGYDPERLVLRDSNIPGERIERQAFLGAALLAHGIALHRYLIDAVRRNGTDIHFVAFTGESFGIITAAVAAGALSVADGTKIAHALAPFILVGAEGVSSSSPLQARVAKMLAAVGITQPLALQPAHVVALTGHPDVVHRVLAAIGDVYDVFDVELHKTYAANQANVYVRTGVRESFGLFMRNFPDIAVTELKEPTHFIAHAIRMAPVREAFARMMDNEGIQFRDAHTPLICNHANRIVHKAADVRDAVLSIIDRVMQSRRTADNCEQVGGNVVLELGQGSKSVRLLVDNGITLPAIAYAGGQEDTDALVAATTLLQEVGCVTARDTDGKTQLRDGDFAVLRRMFGLPARYPVIREFMLREFTRMISAFQVSSPSPLSPSLRRFLEIYQHTSAACDDLDLAGGELALQVQAKKCVVGDSHTLGRVTTEIKILKPDGSVTARCSTGRWTPEALVFHFSRLDGAPVLDLIRSARRMAEHHKEVAALYEKFTSTLSFDAKADETGPSPVGVISPQAVATFQILHQLALLILLRAERPAIFLSHDYYFASGDVLGWCVALCAADALDPEDAVTLYSGHLRGAILVDETPNVGRDDVLGRLRDAAAPLVSVTGVPITAAKDIASTTRGLFELPLAEQRRCSLRLNGDVQIVCLGADHGEGIFDTAPYGVAVTVVSTAEQIAQRSHNAHLEALEHGCFSSLTSDNQRVLHFARGRKILSSTVFSYVKLGERVLGFGKGGSESMTMFVTAEDHHAA
ncbi:hypothetical protein ABHV46_01170 [Asaia sp. BMEF1]|uniref:hypothetical protein n=1 Tax=Asaia sp. BMEF1 TaxID=3155932 RepID=UPI003F67CBC4